MDELVKKLAAFGVPAVILLIAMGATGLSGAAALTAALAALGPFGMIGGLALLAFIGLSIDKITEVGYEKLTILVIREQLKTISKEEMERKVQKLLITKGMKLKILNYINKAEIKEQQRRTP